MKVTLPRKLDIARSLFIGCIVILVVVVSFGVIHQYQDKKAEALQRQAEVKVQQDAYNKVISQKELDRQAMINRLFSICMDAQQSFDKLAAKDKAGKVRPDCSIVE